MSSPFDHDYRDTAEPAPTLRVQVDGELICEKKLYPGLSIGRAPSNAVCIDSAEIALIQARVELHGSSYVLAMSEPDRLSLADGTPISQLRLAPGAQFCIGPATFECVNTPQRVVPLTYDQTILAHQCERCRHDLSRLPAEAQFCPRCGLRRIVEDVVDSPSPHPPVDLTMFETPAKREFVHSLMLLGYASAMNSLGSKYETGLGVSRNEWEALRCYCKAARLGNEQAQERLRNWSAAAADECEHTEDPGAH